MLTVRLASFEGDDERAIRQIRNNVFTHEQGISAALDFDGLDASARHVLAFFNDEVVGTGRMLRDGHIGRIAVLQAHRGQSVGTKIVLALISAARAERYERVYLGSQTHAKGFYERLGFQVFGGAFMDAGDIPHVSMEKVLGR